jgi:D-alanyl-D-alanine carboxypeptidase
MERIEGERAGGARRQVGRTPAARPAGARLARAALVALAAGVVALGPGGAAAGAPESEPVRPMPVAPPLAYAPLATHPAVADRLALFAIWADEQRRHLDQPGVAIAVVHGDELVWARGFGLADVAARRPVTPETVFRLGSITKTFTATALLQLRDAGKLSLDDPVRRHLPWFGVAGPAPAGVEGPSAEITIRQLLTHTAGLPREAPLPYWTDRAFPTHEQLRAAVREGVAMFEPGEGYEYSNLGIALAGEVVATASGMPWEEYVRRHVLDPLGMAASSAAAPRVPAERLATGYLTRGADGVAPVAPPTVSRALGPAAEMSASALDLARYVSAHLAGYGSPMDEMAAAGGGAALLAPRTLREMHRVHWLSPSWQSGRGLGFSVWRQGDRTLVGHGGWVAGHRAQIALEPATGVGIVVLTNSDEGGPSSYVRQAFELLAPAIEEAAAPPAAEPPPPADPERFAGTYRTPWNEVTEVLVFDGGLVLYGRGHPPSEDPEGSLDRLVSTVEEGVFRVATDDGTGDRVVFDVEGGRVVRVKVGENYLFPLDCGEIGPDLRCTWKE